MSQRETIMAAIATALSTIPDSTFFRSREAAFGLDEGTCILLEPEEELVIKHTQAAPALTFRKCTIVLTVITRSDVPDQTADPIMSAIQIALLKDPTLGGLCAQMIEVSTKWAFAEADSTASTAEVRYQLLYLTTATGIAQ